jgi:hypothetical protein
MLVKIALAVLMVVIIAFGGIYYHDYLSQTARAESINIEIQNNKNANTIVSKNIQKVNSDIADIARNESTVNKDIEKEIGQLPDKINPNEIVKDIIIQGKASQVSIIPLSTDEWVKTQVNKNDYQVLRIHLEAKGPQKNVVEFISQMQNSAYETLIIEKITMHKPFDPLDTDIIADVNLAMYAK